MIVSVNYRSKYTGEFGGRAYSYRCDVQDIEPGEVVLAPTKNGESEAKVVEINIPESQVEERILPLLKTITKRKEAEDDGE